MKKQLLFVHGGYEVQCPKMPDDEDSPQYAAWRDRIASELAELGGEVSLVGHSQGASILLKYISEERTATPIAGMFLVAAPYWGVEDWDIDEYVLQEDFASKLPEGLPMFFYHSRDDEWVPFAHLALYAEKVPHARFRVFDGRGHQFDEDLSEVAHDIEGLERSES